MARRRDDASRIDEADPVSRFITDRLGLTWPKILFIAFLVYGPVEKLLIPAVGGYLHLSGPPRTWVPDVEALLTGFVEFPIFLAYYIWSGRGVGRVFERLGATEVFADAQRYHQFWTRARRALSHPAVAVGGAVLAAVFMLLWHFYLWGPTASVPPWFEIQWQPATEGADGRLVHLYGSNPVARTLSVLLIGVVGYAVSQIVIREGLVLVWLNRLWRELGDGFVVHPYHPDEAGGLGAIGQHALHLSMFVLVLLVFIVMGTILPSLRAGSGSSVLLDGVVITGWVLYVLFVALTVSPLLFEPHERMCEKRHQRVAVVSARLDALLERQQLALDSKGDELESVTKRIAALKAVRSQVLDDYPVWPFSLELRVKLGLTSIPAFLLPGLQYLLKTTFAGLARLFQGAAS